MCDVLHGDLRVWGVGAIAFGNAAWVVQSLQMAGFEGWCLGGLHLGELLGGSVCGFCSWRGEHRMQ